MIYRAISRMKINTILHQERFACSASTVLRYSVFGERSLTLQRARLVLSYVRRARRMLSCVRRARRVQACVPLAGRVLLGSAAVNGKLVVASEGGRQRK